MNGQTGNKDDGDSSRSMTLYGIPFSCEYDSLLILRENMHDCELPSYDCLTPAGLQIASEHKPKEKFIAKLKEYVKNAEYALSHNGPESLKKLRGKNREEGIIQFYDNKTKLEKSTEFLKQIVEVLENSDSLIIRYLAGQDIKELNRDTDKA